MVFRPLFGRPETSSPPPHRRGRVRVGGGCRCGNICGAAAKRFCEPPPPARPSPALGRRGGGRLASVLPFQTAFSGFRLPLRPSEKQLKQPEKQGAVVFRWPLAFSGCLKPPSFPRRRESCLGLDGGVFPCLWLMVFAKIPACAGMTTVRPCGFSDCLCFQAASKVIRHPRCAFHTVVRRSGIDTRRFLSLPAFTSRASMPDLPRIPPQSSVQAGAARGRRRVCRPEATHAVCAVSRPFENVRTHFQTASLLWIGRHPKTACRTTNPVFPAKPQPRAWLRHTPYASP